MDIEELNSQRDKFMDSVAQIVSIELQKIGLRLINANLTDISDEIDDTETLARVAATEAIA